MSLHNIHNFVYIKLMSGEIIQFEISDEMMASELYCVENLKSEFTEYIENLNNENNEKIDLERVVFFDDNFEMLELNDKVILGNTYSAFIKDSIVTITFNRTIRLHHDYNKFPRNTVLEINIDDWNAYRYMYNELKYMCTFDEFGDYECFDTDIEHKFLGLLQEYNLEDFSEDFDFRELQEEIKINLIKAYMREYLTLNTNIQSYRFI